MLVSVDWIVIVFGGRRIAGEEVGVGLDFVGVRWGRRFEGRVGLEVDLDLAHGEGLVSSRDVEVGLRIGLRVS